MMTTIEYLDAVKARLDLPSDYAAAKALGVVNSAVSRYRHGKGTFDDLVAFKVAEILGINPLEVICAINHERAANDEQRESWTTRWENFSQSFQSLVSRADARQLTLWQV
jgi:hypothetical protein